MFPADPLGEGEVDNLERIPTPQENVGPKPVHLTRPSLGFRGRCQDLDFRSFEALRAYF